METGERQRALDLLVQKLRRLDGREKLKVFSDVDDSSAATSLRVINHLGLDPKLRGRRYYWSELKHDRFIEGYDHVWLNNWKDIPPLLDYSMAKKMAESTDFRFISAREEKTVASLRKWVSCFYPDLDIPIIVVSPNPHSAHGVRKLARAPHLLIDDSPVVPPVMWDGNIAKGSILFVVDTWEEATKNINPSNTAVLRDANQAAEVVIEAVKFESARREVEGPRKQRVTS